MADQGKRLLLDLDELSERRYILIDGREYETINADELTIVERHALGRKAERYYELLKALDQSGDGTEEMQRTIMEVLDTLCRALVPELPDEVLARLSPWKRQRIVDAFFADFLRSLQRAMGLGVGTRGPSPES